MKNMLLVAAAALGLALGAYPSVAQDTITLKVAHGLPATHFAWEKGIRLMFDEVTEKTGGRVQFEVFPAGQLGKDNAAVLKSGIADIAMVVPNYTADKFPLTSVTELPDVYSSSCEGTEKYWNVVKPGGPLSVAEYEPQGLRALFAIAVQPNVLWTTKQVRDMSDLSGLKLYANGAAVNRIARDLGAVPIRLSAPELYDSVMRGTVDGAFFPQSSIVAYGLDEKLRYMVKGTKFGATNWVVAISDRAWGKLPEDVQGLLTEAGIKASQAFCAYNDEEIERVNERLTSEGKLTVTTLSEEQAEAWRKATASVSDEWLKDMATAGQDGVAMLKAYRGETN